MSQTRSDRLTSSPLTSLGPYELERPLGRGGMGEVWRATHRAQRVSVAIKVLTGDRTREERFRRALRAEIRAVAALNHPNIARIYDHGEVPEGAAATLPPPFVAHAPYLVLELVEGGSLRGLCGQLSWDAIRWVLQSLLEALAHAHARGVVHRDLKPENVLLGRRSGSIKLTDFGLAVPFETPQEARNFGRFAGTPAYMAPEQVEGRWRDYGPWTDLYGLGCLAFSLATGQPPFVGGGMLDVLNAHVGRPVPPMVARSPLPQGFESWVMALLEKDPTNRPQLAADALRALQALAAQETAGGMAPAELFAAEPSGASTQEDSSGTGGLQTSGDAPRPPPLEAAPRSSHVHRSWSSTWSDTWGLLHVQEEEVGTPVTSGALSDEGPTARVRVGPPPSTPQTWRRNAPYPTITGADLLSLRGVGLGLFGLRILPIVGRESERDALWASLVEVSRGGAARAVVLHGQEGIGKSRLAVWLCERAEEIGAATSLRALFTHGAGATEGFSAMLARLFRSVGLSREEVLGRVRESLRRDGVRDPDEINALTELIRPATPEDIQAGARPIRFGSPLERHALLRRALERVAAGRPLIVWLDGAEHSPDALAWTRHLLDAQEWEPSPILVVLTCADTPTGALSPELSGLLALPEVSQVPLGPLSPMAQGLLVRDLLGLEGELAHQIEARTAGNPQFAVQLVGHWAERGLLVASESGYQLAPGRAPELPEHLYRVWEERVARLLEGASTAECASLELAAVLGQEVRADERRAALQAAGLPQIPAKIDEMLAQGLAWPGDGGVELSWSFTHGAIRAVLEARALQAGRLAAHHLACATMLATRGGPDVLERRARHLLEAGSLQAALPALIEAIRARIAEGAYQRAAGLLGRWEQAVATLGLEPEDRRRGEGLVLGATLARLEGRLEDASARAEAVSRAARTFGWTSVAARATWELARVTWNRGDPDRALRLGQEAELLADALGDETFQAECARDLGAMFAHRGEHSRASERLWGAQRAFARLGDAVGEAYALLSLGQIAQREDRLKDAERCYARALDRFSAAGSRRGVADCDNSLGELARLRGDLVGAEASYRAARAGFQAVGSGMVIAPEANLGLVLVERGRFSEAREVLEGTLSLARRQGRRVVEGNVHAYLLPTLAAVRDWSALEQHRAAAEALLAESGIVEEDIARMAETAGRLALEAGRADAARLVLQLAARQWEGLGRPQDASRARSVAP